MLEAGDILKVTHRCNRYFGIIVKLYHGPFTGLSTVINIPIYQKHKCLIYRNLLILLQVQF